MPNTLTRASGMFSAHSWSPLEENSIGWIGASSRLTKRPSLLRVPGVCALSGRAARETISKATHDANGERGAFEFIAEFTRDEDTRSHIPYRSEGRSTSERLTSSVDERFDAVQESDLARGRARILDERLEPSLR